MLHPVDQPYIHYTAEGYQLTEVLYTVKKYTFGNVQWNSFAVDVGKFLVDIVIENYILIKRYIDKIDKKERKSESLFRSFQKEWKSAQKSQSLFFRSF